MRIEHTAIALTFVVAASMPAGAASISIGAAHDNTIYADPGPELSNGAGPSMFAGRSGNGELRRGLISFDIASAIPAGSTITGVSLSMRQTAATSPALPATVALHSVLASWGEGTSVSGGGGGQGAPASANDATWLSRFFGVSSWTSPGGDFNPVATASTVTTGNALYSWSSAAMIAEVQAWLDSPATNFGWLIKGDESASLNAKRFDTRESATPANRPSLTIEYVIPSPAAGAMLILSAFPRRRR